MPFVTSEKGLVVLRIFGGIFADQQILDSRDITDVPAQLFALDRKDQHRTYKVASHRKGRL